MTVRERCILAAVGSCTTTVEVVYAKNKEAPPYFWRRHCLCVKSYPLKSFIFGYSRFISVGTRRNQLFYK
jgi:hypothetical protein